MTCLDAQAHLSAFHDGEKVSDTDLAAAREHCAECAECTAFAEGLRYLDLMPVPPAPEGLVDSVLDAIRPMAEERAILRLLDVERAEADSVGTEAPLPEIEPALENGVEEVVAAEPEYVPVAAASPVRPGGLVWFNGPVRWATLGAGAALAATALVAFVVIGMNGQQASTRSAVTSPQSGAPLASGAGNAALDGATATAPEVAPTPAPATAPDYVAYKQYVYAPGSLLADANSATPTIGTLVTAFASGGAPQEVKVHKSPLTDGSIVVPGPDGLRLFTPVTRMLSSVKYQLMTGSAIDRFGLWPTLPPRFPVPTNSAGTPSFVTAGADSLGVNIYSATGRPVTEGFAVAPGTSGSDPAAGNPSWTWWAPAPTNP